MAGSSRRGLDIALLLLGVMVVELVLNRLAVPALRPITEDPAAWHRGLDHAALFVFYFASALAAFVLVRKLWLLGADEAYPRPARYAVAAFGAAFFALAAYGIVTTPSVTTQLTMQGAFTLALMLLVAAQLVRRGDVAVKLGLLVVALPLALQFYAPFVLKVVHDADLSLYPNVPDTDLAPTLRAWGQLSVVLAALISPYLFAPRPLRLSVPRVAPLVIATFVGLVAGLVVREHYEVGMELAARGLGFEIGPAAPRPLVALYLLALASITWTVASCLMADAPARRRIGVGLGLVVIGGYAFAWPVQYMAAFIGMLVVADAAGPVGAEEEASSSGRDRFQAPRVDDETWQTYVASLIAALRAQEPADEPAPATAVTFDKELGMSETHVSGRRRGVSFRIRVRRADGALQMIDVGCGEEPVEADEPAWTLHARPERMLALGTHPEPPPTSAPVRRTGDEPFDRRFRVRDAAEHTEALFDDALRARATAVIDGWLACWPDHALYYRVFPGRGAPLDHPIPVSELAFRGTDAPAAVDRLLSLLDLLVDTAKRAGL